MSQNKPSENLDTQVKSPEPIAARQTISDDEIDLLELARVIWSKRRFIAKVTSVFFVLGLVIAFTSKVEYEATCKLLPESQESSLPDLGGLGGLAGLAGFDLSSLSSGGSVLSPEIYPEIVNSTPFLDKLINSPVYFEKKDTIISSFDYFLEIDRPSLFDLIIEYTFGLPTKIKSLFIDSDQELESYDLVRFSKEEWEILDAFKDRLSVEFNAETSTLEISSEMPDPVAAAKVTNLLVKELTERVSGHKIEKSKNALEFIEKRFDESKSEYEIKQRQLARFTNSNRNISNPITEIEHKRLENELSIAFEVYKGLATQLEQARIKVKEETPVFTVLEPVRVPEEKSWPKRGIIIIIFLILGLVLSIGGIVSKEFLKKLL